jgi:chromate transporter
MLYLKLFWEFLKVGLFTFGGGYGSIPIIREAVLSNSWMNVDEELFSYIVGIAESTPGPIMINSATYIGNHCGGFLGALFATLGVVTPSFVIILLIASLLKGFMEKKPVRSVLDTIKPCVVGIILCTGLYLICSGLIPALSSVSAIGSLSDLIPQVKTVILFALVFAVRTGWRLWKKKVISPILSIAVSAVLGIVVYGV